MKRNLNAVMIVLVLFALPLASNAQTKVIQDRAVNAQLAKMVEYPQSAIAEGKEATVIVKFKTDEKGLVEKITKGHREKEKDFYIAAKKAIVELSDSDYVTLLKANHVYKVPFHFRLND